MADFGLSRKIAESSNASGIFGVIPYIDQKGLNDQNYKLNKQSDVYSIGVLLWQISSGYEPFKGKEYDVRLAVSICKGLREKTIDEIPDEYNELYQGNK